MVLKNYQNFTEMTSNMIYIVAFGVDLKCPHKIHLNTQCLMVVIGLKDMPKPGGAWAPLAPLVPLSL